MLLSLLHWRDPNSTKPAAVNVLESDLVTPMNSLEVFFDSGEFLSLLPIFHERLSHCFDVSFWSTGGNRKAIGLPMPCLAESGGAWVQSVRRWHRSGSSGWAGATADPALRSAESVLSVSGVKTDISVPLWVVPGTFLITLVSYLFCHAAQ